MPLRYPHFPPIPNYRRMQIQRRPSPERLSSPGSQSNDHLIDEDTLIYMHHVFYSKSGNTYYGSLTFNSAFAVPLNYTDYKYYY